MDHLVVSSIVSSSRATKHSLDNSNSANSSPSPNLSMPMNVKGMLLHGVKDSEVLQSWLISIKCEELVTNFLDNGYDMPLLTRMTPQDLAAVGCKSPSLRKKLLAEIKKLNLEDDVPNFRPHSLEKWLELLKLSEYQTKLCEEGYNTIDKVCGLTWEDLEEIGIYKLGHQKRLLLGIERIKKFDKQQEDRISDNPIYDVHPNHRISLNQNSNTISRSSVRSGFFKTRTGATLDHRGLPVATVMPALQHVNSSMANLDISQKIPSSKEVSNGQSYNSTTLSWNVANNTVTTTNNNNTIQNQSVYQTGNLDNALKLNDLSATLKRNPPPLPPVRTNSLKIPLHRQSSADQVPNIYGNSYSSSEFGGNLITPQTGSTSFLRTPKLGTLTPTTNKMLTLGGHIQSVNGQTAIRSMFPVREAPLPPIHLQNPTRLPERIDEEQPVLMQNFTPAVPCPENPLMINSSIGHQLASADEFPPPPPCQ